ncbi:MAG: choice-of-anchor L domain-containing protein [Polyangiaceae bacterium]
MRRRAWWTAVVLVGAAAVTACGATEGDTGGGGQPSATGGGAGVGGAATGGAGGSGGQGMVDPCANVTCQPGEVCDEGTCVMGCSDTEPCSSGLACCGGICVDLTSDVDNCGACDKSCPDLENQAVTCQANICSVGGCLMGFYDCDGMPGCESATACSCTPGDTQACYPGPPGTENNGPCQMGTRKCNQAGTAWGLCEGFVLPNPEICANNVDEDCSGVADDVPDIDGDGWTACDNDCCEVTQDCSNPAAVNPGAYEVVGNMLDDDCDLGTSDTVAPSACSTTADFSATALQMAQAMELCQQTTVSAPLPTRKWGLLGAEIRFANGTTPNTSQLTSIQNNQIAILQNYGNNVTPQAGPTMAGMSSGLMRDQGDSGYVNPNPGTDFARSSQPPAAYLAANGGALPASAGCSGNCPAGSGANDSVNLRLSIRVPTNAQSFSYDFRFFSSEYWTYSCTQYNDFYLALLTSGAMGIPADKNISFDSLSNPVSVNNGFFDYCVPKGCYTCPLGTSALNGTGMQLSSTGGGTSWLTTTAPIVPGETMVLELMIFDVSDGVLDSLTLLDNFEWSLTPSTVGTGPAG